MKHNNRLDILNAKSFDCAEFMKTSEYITNEFFRYNGAPYTGEALKNKIQINAEMMKLGADLVKTKYWVSGLIIGGLAVYVIPKIAAIVTKETEQEEA